jgi:hypothetical protein
MFGVEAIQIIRSVQPLESYMIVADSRYGSTGQIIEVAWTLAPAIILVFEYCQGIPAKPKKCCGKKVIKETISRIRSLE